VSATEAVEGRVTRLLDAARCGDSEAFRALVLPHLRSLHVHCYRMLGSYDDAEDAVQEALLSAWRGLDSYEGRAPLLHWLYRITTTTCLKMLRGRTRRPATVGELTYLQPYPDRLLDQLTDADADPAAVAQRRESVALAFIAALQRLPATQRAVLILRDVLAWSSAEVADLLQTSVPSVNSALQRARTTLRAADPAQAQPDGSLDARDRLVMDRFVRAWQRCDIPALAALLREDAILRMPPEAVEIRGRDLVAAFFATVPADGRLDLIPLLRTEANGHPALAAYLPDDTGYCRGYGIMVFTVVNGVVATITGFPDPRLFGLFGLPDTPPGAAAP
jgi:RNA polymerase sigma-70 factor (ECF subfamily)